MTTRLVSSTLFPLLTAVLGTACSDDGNPGNLPDARMPDARVVDAEVPGDCGCPLTDAGPPPYEYLPEGGEFRLERFQLGPDDTDAELAAQAFFFKDQVPPLRPFGGAPIALRQGLVSLGYACQDYRAGNNFDNGKSDVAQDIVDSRAYYDVGATATLTNAEDAADVITLGRFLASLDPTAAIDRSSGLVHEVLYKAPEATLVERNARYLPAIADSPAYSELDLRFGESATGEELAGPNGLGTPQIFMPSAFTLTSPAEADFYGEGALVFTRGQDLSITYDPGDVTPPGWPTIMPFIGFVNDAGTVEAYCFKFSPGAQENGQFTVPYEVLNVVQADPGGHVVFGRMVHAVWTSIPHETRMDLMGIESKVSPGFVIQDATPASK